MSMRRYTKLHDITLTILFFPKHYMRLCIITKPRHMSIQLNSNFETFYHLPPKHLSCGCEDGCALCAWYCCYAYIDSLCVICLTTPLNRNIYCFVSLFMATYICLFASHASHVSLCYSINNGN